MERSEEPQVVYLVAVVVRSPDKDKSTKDIGSKDSRSSCVLDVEGGTCININSASYASSILVGGGIESMDDPRDACLTSASFLTFCRESCRSVT